MVQIEGLYDQFSRRKTTLRISVTDACNLRCKYCVVSSNIPFLKPENLMSYEEIEKIIDIFVSFGIDRLRITGGEPLVRPGLLEFIKRIKIKYPKLKILMTTNGLLLQKHALELIQSGIETLNVSIDTLDPKKFRSITGADKLKAIIDGVKTVKEKSNIRIKVNCVILKGINDSTEEFQKFIDFGNELDVIIRFIEFMPFTGNDWSKDRFVSSEAIRKKIESKFTLVKESVSHVSQTSRIYTIKENNVKLGFISSVSESFCQWCNRLRITADGNLRTCLHSKNETNLVNFIREGKSDEFISQIIKKSVYFKPAGHDEFLSPKFFVPENDREMIRIGG